MRKILAVAAAAIVALGVAVCGDEEIVSADPVSAAETETLSAADLAARAVVVERYYTNLATVNEQYDSTHAPSVADRPFVSADAAERWAEEETADVSEPPVSADAAEQWAEAGEPVLGGDYPQ